MGTVLHTVTGGDLSRWRQFAGPGAPWRQGRPGRRPGRAGWDSVRTAASVWGALRRGTDWRTREGSRGCLVFGDLLRRPWDSGERGTCDCDVTVKAPPGRGQGGPDTEPSPWGVGTAAGPAHAPRAHRPLPSPASGHPGSIGPQCTLGHVTGPAPAPAPWGEVQSPHHPARGPTARPLSATRLVQSRVSSKGLVVNTRLAPVLWELPRWCRSPPRTQGPTAGLSPL